MVGRAGRFFAVWACLAVLAGLVGCGAGSGGAGKPGKALDGEAGALVRAGDAALAAGQAQRALEAYDRAGKAGADEALVRERQCRAHLAGRSYKAALDACRACLAAWPDDPEALYGAGYASLMLHDPAAAAGYLEKALEISPDMVQAARTLGLAHYQAQNHDRAVAVLEQALASGGADPDTQNNLGLALLSLGRADEAAAAFRASLSGKDSPRTRNNLGLALCRIGSFEEAYAAFAAAGGEAAAHNNLGVCYREQGMTGKAAEEFEKAIARNPRYYRTASENLNRLSTSEPPTPPAAPAAAAPPVMPSDKAPAPGGKASAPSGKDGQDGTATQGAKPVREAKPSDAGHPEGKKAAGKQSAPEKKAAPAAVTPPTPQAGPQAGPHAGPDAVDERDARAQEKAAAAQPAPPAPEAGPPPVASAPAPDVPDGSGAPAIPAAPAMSGDAVRTQPPTP